MFRSTNEASLIWTLRVMALMSGAVVILIAAFLVIESWPSIREVGLIRFFGDGAWYPAGLSGTSQFNIVPMVIGTLVSALGATILAAPLGVGSAIFCRFYAPRRIAGLYRNLLGILAGIPSVVYGFWGLVVLAPLLRQWQPPGQSLLAATLILTVMIVPTVALISETSLRSVPRAYLHCGGAWS